MPIWKKTSDILSQQYQEIDTTVDVDVYDLCYLFERISLSEEMANMNIEQVDAYTPKNKATLFIRCFQHHTSMYGIRL
jgi:hypothetical protein